MIKVNSKTFVVAIYALLFCMSASSQAALMALATIYKTVHKDGTVTYSDQASPTATKVVFDVPTSTIQSKVQPSIVEPQINTKQKIKYQVSILNPQPEETIRNNLGEILIGATIEPKMGGFFQLHINQHIHESATGMFKLDNMERGTYEYSIKFIDNSGKVIASSEDRKLYMHKASALIK